MLDSAVGLLADAFDLPSDLSEAFSTFPRGLLEAALKILQLACDLLHLRGEFVFELES